MIIEMFPAKNGDSFLIRLDNKKNILVDMGYADTYKNYIKDRLLEIKNENQCIDLLIITHIDEDHIEGAIEFFKENGYSNNPKIIEVKEIWHNSYRHLQFDKDKIHNISNFEERQLQEVKFNNSSVIAKEINEINPISAKQGSTLSGYLYGFGYESSKWNSSFKSKAINLDNKKKIQLDDIKIYILSPNTEKLKSISKLWMRKLIEIDNNFSISDEEIFDDAYEMYIKKIKSTIDTHQEENISHSSTEFKDILDKNISKCKEDVSKSNGTSIAFILEYKNIKVLFLGDSHEDIIIESLKRYKKSGKELKFDAVKVSHHGSIKNNFNWIENIAVDNYIISTNGQKHQHPDKEVIAKILKSNKRKKTLYFNYALDICNKIESDILKQKYNYSLVVAKQDSSLKIEVSDR